VDIVYLRRCPLVPPGYKKRDCYRRCKYYDRKWKACIYAAEGQIKKHGPAYGMAKELPAEVVELVNATLECFSNRFPAFVSANDKNMILLEMKLERDFTRILSPLLNAAGRRSDSEVKA
jgi:hypothetical protein